MYIFRRLFRLYPAFIVTFEISVLLTPMSMEALIALPGDSARNLERIEIFQGSLYYAELHITAHLTMLHGIVPGHLLPFTDYAFLGQAWSISMEWQFYLLAPIFFSLTRGSYLPLRIGAALAVAAVLHKSRIWFGQGYIGGHVAWFALGMGSFEVWKR